MINVMSFPFPPSLRHGYYRITAVAARPKPNTPVVAFKIYWTELPLQGLLAPT